MFKELSDLKNLNDLQFAFRYYNRFLKKLIDQTIEAGIAIIEEVELPSNCTPRFLNIYFIRSKGLYGVGLDPNCATYRGKNPELAKLCEDFVTFTSWEDMTDFFLRMEVM